MRYKQRRRHRADIYETLLVADGARIYWKALEHA
jgi:hypothetical protein